jgi:hypothetical protein
MSLIVQEKYIISYSESRDNFHMCSAWRGTMIGNNKPDPEQHATH